jgi:hypothetical protein
MELYRGWYVLISADPEPLPDFVEKKTCTICFEPGCDCITSCGHCFHYECVKSWLIKEDTCPNCREDVKVILQYEV